MEQIFHNEQVFPYQLPSVDKIEWHPILPTYRKVMRLVAVINWFIAIALAIGASFLFETEPYNLWWLGITLPLLVLGLVVNLLWVNKAFAIRGYAVRELDICSRSGFIFTKTQVIPYRRLQQISLKQGPLDRLAGSHTLELFVAGSSGSDVSIHGLSLEDAQRAYSFILDQIRLDEQH